MQTARWPVVVFDLDGTLVNTIPLIVASYRHALRAVLDQELDEATIRGWIGRTLVSTFRDVDPDRADELVEAYLDFNLEQMPHLVQPFEGVAELLADLRTAGLVVGVATSKRRHSAELTLASVGLQDAVPLTTTMEDTLTHKPAPEPVLHALDALGRRPDEAVYIGDAVVDVLAAHAAGTSSVAVTWGAGEPEALRAVTPTALVTSTDELRTVLLG